MATELVMRGEVGFASNAFNPALRTKRMASSRAMPNVASRLATMKVLAGKNRTPMSMRNALAFVRRRKGVPIKRTRGIPGQGKRPLFPAVGQETNAKVAVAKKVMRRTKGKGTPQMRVAMTVRGLVYLFCGKGARQLNENGKRVVKAVAKKAMDRAKASQFPALSIKEIEAIYRVCTS